MAYDEQLAARIRAAMGDTPIEEKRMFGGLAFLRKGHMACGIVKDTLMVRVGPELYDDALERPHVEPMTFTGRAMRGMIYVRPQGIQKKADLSRWVKLALEVAESAPPKPKKKKKKAAKKNAEPAKANERPAPGNGAASFQGVSKRAIKFLRELEAHNDKPWFEAHRDEYDATYIPTGEAIAVALAPGLQKLAPKITVEPRVNGSLMRVYRDTRFSKDKTPYRAHIDLWFWQGERKGWNGSGFFFRLAPRSIVLGCGVHRFEPAQLATYREAVLDARKGKALTELLDPLLSRGSYTLSEATRKKLPRGVPSDHPRAPLLLHEGLTVVLDARHPRELFSNAFPAFCLAHYARLLPLHTWLSRHVAQSP